MDFKSFEDVPKEIRDKMHYVGAVAARGRSSVVVYSEGYKSEVGQITFQNAIVDTSIYVQGAKMESRFSHVDWLTIGGSYAWTIRPLSLEEQ